MIQSPEAAGFFPFMTPSSACIFCRIVAGEVEASLVYRDEAVTAFMDAHPVAEGHLLVVPNRHAAGLEDLDESDAAGMIAAARKLAAALRRSGLPCDGVNLLLADGQAAGQTVFHCHLHVIPRTSRDGFGFRRPLGVGRDASPEVREAAAVRIRAQVKV